MICTAGRLSRLFRLPILLVTLHCLLMMVAGLGWVRASSEWGAAFVGPEAHFWLDVVEFESFPASRLARYALEADLPKLLRTYGSFGLSLNAVLGTAYWLLLLVFGALQWYLIGLLWLKVRYRLQRKGTDHEPTSQ